MLYNTNTNGGDLEKQKEKTPAELTEDEDPWQLPEITIQTVKWEELDGKGKVKRVITSFILKPACLITLLYLFICSIDLLASAFRLLGGKAAGKVFQQAEILNNPIAGLMVGVLVTVLVQSSSTSTSIIVTMVGTGILPVKAAVPMIFGANIGTTVTNTLVALPQSGNKAEFRRAFAGATVHDCFNWLTVLILLPVNSATNFMVRMTDAMVSSGTHSNDNADVQFLKVITDPFTKLIVQIDKDVIEKIAQDEAGADELPVLKTWCKWNETVVPCDVTTVGSVVTDRLNYVTETVCIEKEGLARCKALFSQFDMFDEVAGVILLIGSLVILCSCLVLIVKLLHSMLQGHIAVWLRKTLNANFPGRLSCLTGYVSMVVGAGITILVQSSSIFTSALTPLVGVGLVTVERMYPLTLGSNIGTTVTGILAALTSTTEQELKNAMQIALCHLFFNILGILIWYPIPLLRNVPIRGSKFLGNTTAEYRWFAIVYLIIMYFLLPLAIFGLSLISLWAVIGVFVAVAIVIILVIIINILQNKAPQVLPVSMRTWHFLPEPMRSLAPYDRVITRCCAFCKCCKNIEEQEKEDISDVVVSASTSASSTPSLPLKADVYSLSTDLYSRDNLGFENDNFQTKL